MRKIVSALLLAIICISSSCTLKKTGQPAVSFNMVWSQSDKSYNNYRIPSVIVTQKGTLLAFAEGREAGDAGDIDILLKRSSDQGMTWDKELVVWNDDNNSCGNPCPVIDRSTGRIILFLTWNLGTDHEDVIIRKEGENTRIPFMCYSDDDGISWSEPVNMMQSCKNPAWGWYATGPGIGIQLESSEYKNRLIIPCNNSYDVDNKEEAVREGFGYGSHVLISDDGGDQWRMSEIITPGCNESQVVELANGDLMMNMRSYHKKGCRAVSISHDGGETWTGVSHNPQLVEPVCQGSIIKYGNYNGKEMYLFANPSVSFDRTHMTIKTSFDEGSNWSNSKLVYEGPSAYSSLVVLPGGNIGLFFEGGEIHAYENMIFVSFQPDELFNPGSLVTIGNN